MPPDFGNVTPTKDNGVTEEAKVSLSDTSYTTAPADSTNDETEVDLVARNCTTRRPSLPRQTSSEIKPKEKLKEDVNRSQSQGNIKVKSSPSQSPAKSRSSIVDINSRTAYLLLDEVRKNTQLSYEMSKVAVTVVVSSLRQILPESMNCYFDAVLEQLQSPFNVSKNCVDETYDASRLKVIFSELTSCKEDSQQRSWMLHEDESIIVEYIKELTSILVMITIFLIFLLNVN